MHTNRSFLLLTVAGTVLLATAFILSSVVARDNVRSRQSHHSPPADSLSQAKQVQVLNAGLWRTDRGFNATIRVTNLLVVGPLDVVRCCTWRMARVINCPR